MSEPRRILDGPSATPFERNLLESWSSEQPSPGARARALAIAGTAAGTLAAAAAATAAASTSGAAAGTAAPSAAVVAVIAKWGILLALVVGSAVGGVLVLGSARTSDAPPTVTSPSPVATAAQPSMPSMPSTAVAPSAPPPSADEPKAVSPADLPAASPTTPSAAVTATAASSASAAGSAATASFAEEIASFDRARAALDAGDSDHALALVDAYEKRFPSGTFLQEAEVVRVQALARKGDSAGARRAGQRFLTAHPTSPHAARIRAILDASAR